MKKVFLYDKYQNFVMIFTNTNHTKMSVIHGQGVKLPAGNSGGFVH